MLKKSIGSIVVCLVMIARAGGAFGDPAQEASSSGAMKRARENYMLHCATCHGINGDGKGDLADSLGEGVKPRNHTDARIMSARSDEDILKVITNGGKSMGFDEAMPAFSSLLSKEEILGLVKYIRQLCECKKE